jgi:hypothetical protein
VADRTVAVRLRAEVGDYIAKISAAPLSDNVRALAGKDVGAVEDATMRDLVVEQRRIRRLLQAVVWGAAGLLLLLATALGVLLAG